MASLFRLMRSPRRECQQKLDKIQQTSQCFDGGGSLRRPSTQARVPRRKLRMTTQGSTLQTLRDVSLQSPRIKDLPEPNRMNLNGRKCSPAIIQTW
ncbi:uncharacterized protein [Physcomitrium patens]|uniref:uncharacterized protein isoform X2 n=1 Tax=Physcomitrium patens TaxID=3218 RepID=UPI003CCD4A13